LLAPAFGTSQLVWTNVIGVILAALALGSWLGGRLADRRPSERAFGWVLLVGGLAIAAVPLASRPFLAAAMQALAERRIASYLASLAASSLLFAPPVLVLAAATPYAVRLGAWGRSDLGRVAGVLSALAALGSIAGTFVTSLVLLPWLGSRLSLFVVGGALACVGALRAVRWAGRVRAAVLLVLASVGTHGPIRRDPNQFSEGESLYSYFQVTRDRSGTTRLLTNESVSFQSVWPSEGILTEGVRDYLALAPALAERRGPELRVLVVGLAAGTVARQIHAAYARTREVSTHGIELDPALVAVGRTYFGLGSIPGVTVELGDARVAAAGLAGPFDVIVVDVFRGLYLPAHLVTREAFEALRARLTPGGVLALNLATPAGSGRLLGAVVTTLREVFEDVRVTSLPTGEAIDTAVLYASPKPLATPPSSEVPAALRSVRLALAPIEVRPEHRRVLTDDHAPIEWITDLALIEALVATR
jgi:spermidine synthase